MPNDLFPRLAASARPLPPRRDAALRRALASALLACGSAAVAVDLPEPAYAHRVAQPEDAMLALAREAVARADWPVAEYALRQARAIAPGSADVHNLLGLAARRSGRLQDAFVYYREALRLDPDHLGAHEYIGEAWLLAGRPDEARRHLEILRRLCGTDCDAYRELADALARAGR